MRHLLAIMALAALMGCAHSTGDVAVPRRTAYYRIPTYDTAYSRVADVPLAIELNASLAPNVERRADGSYWITAAYARYNATMHLTLTPVNLSTVEGVIDNRTERIHLNFNGHKAEISEFDNAAGYHANMVYAPTASNTPLQLIAVSPDQPKWVLSGAVYFSGAGAKVDADSIRPVYEALIYDVKHLISNLSEQ